jgi:hypothetical protein
VAEVELMIVLVGNNEWTTGVKVGLEAEGWL